MCVNYSFLCDILINMEYIKSNLYLSHGKVFFKLAMQLTAPQGTFPRSKKKNICWENYKLSCKQG